MLDPQATDEDRKLADRDLGSDGSTSGLADLARQKPALTRAVLDLYRAARDAGILMASDPIHARSGEDVAPPARMGVIAEPDPDDPIAE
mgnify:CR=1 FL=1